MGLKSELNKAFEDTLENGGTIEEVAAMIVDAYATAVENGYDTYGNVWVANYSIIESAIVEQFNISLETNEYLQFDLISTSMIGAWATSSVVLPAIPPPSMTAILSGVGVFSNYTYIEPLSELTDNFDIITNRFYDLFINHSKTITLSYVGTSSAVVPVPTTQPVSSYTIK